jgi:hypothetical protein
MLLSEKGSVDVTLVKFEDGNPVTSEAAVA